MKIGVLASGSGTNLQAIIDKIHKSDEVDVEIAVVISDNPKAYALERAKAAGIPAVAVRMGDYKTRDDFDAEIDRILRDHGVELVVLAGYMKILQKSFVSKWRNKIMNIHPALLPSFPGTHGARDAVNYGVKISGVTVHFVDEGVDTGPIIAQRAVPVYFEDTEEDLLNRIHVEEHKLYPEVIRLYSEGKIEVHGRKVKILE